MSTEVVIRRLGPGEHAAVLEAAVVFDRPPKRDATARFLASTDHHLLLASIGGRPAGFVSGVELTHPDKGVEMFLYELGVEPWARRRGIGTALVEALAALARDRRCYGMWVLTDADNEAALATYRRAGALAPENQVFLDWRFGAPEDGRSADAQ